MKRKEYISPQLDIVPYRNAIVLLPPSAETGAEIPFAKEFDDFEEENSDDDLWKDERDGFGLQDWDTNYDE